MSQQLTYDPNKQIRRAGLAHYTVRDGLCGSKRVRESTPYPRFASYLPERTYIYAKYRCKYLQVLYDWLLLQGYESCDDRAARLQSFGNKPVAFLRSANESSWDGYVVLWKSGVIEAEDSAVELLDSLIKQR